MPPTDCVISKLTVLLRTLPQGLQTLQGTEENKDYSQPSRFDCLLILKTVLNVMAFVSFLNPCFVVLRLIRDYFLI